MRTLRRLIGCALAVSILGASLAPAQKKKKNKKDEEPITQVLPVLPDPPANIIVETRKLGFLVAPLSSKGLLSQQVRDGLKFILKSAQAAQVVKLRAFVAGTGDLRRVQSILSETFTEKKLSLPVLSVVQVGGLPLEGAQVQLEAFTQDRKIVNPNGIAFISGQDAASDVHMPKVQPLAEKSAAQLRRALASADPLRVTCFLSSLEDIDAVRSTIGAAFPGIPSTFVQTQRAPERSVVECEAVGRLKSAPSDPVAFVNPEGLRVNPNYSQVALVSAPKLILSGSQLAFRYTEADARLAFQRLDKSLAGVGASLKTAILVNSYPLSPKLADMIRSVRFDFLDKTRPPASTMLPFEGLPGMDASFSLEVVVLAP